MKKIGFIGCGEIAHIHAACILRHGGTVAGGFDLAESSAGKLTAAYGGKIYLSAEELCADPDVDAVYICTRHDSHIAYIAMAAGHGKAVFCEKPIGLRLADAEQAADIVASSGIRFAMGFNHRYSPGMQRLKRFIDQAGSKVDALNAQFVTAPFMQGWAGGAEQGGGVFVCLGSHIFDLVHYLIPGEIQEVKAVSSRIRLGPEYEDDAFAAILMTEAGQMLTLNAHEFGNASYSTDPGHRINTITVFKGHEAASAGTGHFESFSAGGSTMERFPADHLSLWGYSELNRRFLLTLQGKAVEIPGVDAGLFAAQLIERCKEGL